MDPNGDGRVTLPEFMRWHCRNHNISPPDDLEDEVETKGKGEENPNPKTSDGDGKPKQQETENRDTAEVEIRITQLFYKLDKDHSGYLDKEEVKQMGTRMGEKLTTLLSHKLLDKAFAEMDPSGDGKVSLEEFISWHHRTHPTEASHVYAQIRHLFNEIDTDNKGWLDRKEVKKLLKGTGNQLTRRFSFHHKYGSKKESFKRVFGEIDHDGSGKVSFDEFLAWHCRDHNIPLPPKSEEDDEK
eukprot:g2158.t1